MNCKPYVICNQAHICDLQLVVWTTACTRKRMYAPNKINTLTRVINIWVHTRNVVGWPKLVSGMASAITFFATEKRPGRKEAALRSKKREILCPQS